MPVDQPLAAQPDYTATLEAVAAAFRGDRSSYPAAQDVVEALLYAEKAAKQGHLTYPFVALGGQWRLCFTAPRKAHFKAGVPVGKGWYVPKFAPASISFAPSVSDATDATGSGTIGNQLTVGTFRLQFTGPCRYLGKKNLLVFDFTKMQVQLLGRTIFRGKVPGSKPQAIDFELQPTSQLPFFAFFLVTEDLLAARGRGGGLAIWVRDRNALKHPSPL